GHRQYQGHDSKPEGDSSSVHGNPVSCVVQGAKTDEGSPSAGQIVARSQSRSNGTREITAQARTSLDIRKKLKQSSNTEARCGDTHKYGSSVSLSRYRGGLVLVLVPWHGPRVVWMFTNIGVFGIALRRFLVF